MAYHHQVWRCLLALVETMPPSERDVFFDTIVAVMVREEMQIHSLTASGQDEPWVKEACSLFLMTHTYVTERLTRPGMYVLCRVVYIAIDRASGAHRTSGIHEFGVHSAHMRHTHSHVHTFTLTYKHIQSSLFARLHSNIFGGIYG